MDITLLTEDKDPMGSAVYDYFKQGKAARLRVFSSQFEEDEIPVKDLFRSYEEMPLRELKAVQRADGKILDVGAGSCGQTLALRKTGKEALAIDISPLSVMSIMP